MNSRVTDILSKIKAWWQSSSTTKKLRTAGLLVLALAIVAIMYGFLTNPNWQPLYTNLSPRTAGQITTQLTQMKVPYQLTDQGRTILVPQKDVNQVRVNLADQNIPSGTVGLPTPMTFTLGETNQEIQLTQLADLEASLEQTISSITGIHSSRVLINQPSPQLFGESQSNPTASVFVDLAPGASLNPGQVRGIINLVAHSVSGLSPKEVTVVNQHGTVLSDGVLNQGNIASITGMTTAQLNDETAVANSIRSNVEAILNQVLGPGHAAVQVNAALNFTQSTVSAIKYGKGVLSSQQVQTGTNTQTAPNKAAGVAANTPVYPTAGLQGPSNSSQKTLISNWLVDKTITHQTVPSGAISRLTVAVAVDKRLSPQQQATLTSLISAAAGIKLARGDKVVVTGQPFNRTAVTSALQAMKQAQQAQTIRQLVIVGILVLLGLFLLLWLRRTIKRVRAARPSLPVFKEPDPAPTRVSVADLLNEMRQTKEPSLADAAREHLDQMVKTDPEAVARLMRAWMQEDGA